MKKQTYLGIATSARAAYIYRIISVPRLFELFERKQNVLVEPSKWEDPFENFILRSQQPYGQCWTLQRASDAMWRIYSPNCDAVRIRSTVLKLVQSLSDAPGKNLQGDSYIGRVRYLPNQELMTFAKRVCQSSSMPSSKVIAETLLVKRPAFKHEREVRLVFVPNAVGHINKDSISYHVDPHALIDQIMIDPRMSVNEWKTLKDKIKTQLTFSGAIKRSLLYAPPPDLKSTIWSAKESAGSGHCPA